MATTVQATNAAPAAAAQTGRAAGMGADFNTFLKLDATAAGQSPLAVFRSHPKFPGHPRTPLPTDAALACIGRNSI